MGWNALWGLIGIDQGPDELSGFSCPKIGRHIVDTLLHKQVAVPFVVPNDRSPFGKASAQSVIDPYTLAFIQGVSFETI